MLNYIVAVLREEITASEMKDIYFVYESLIARSIINSKTLKYNKTAPTLYKKFVELKKKKLEDMIFQ